MISSMTLLHLNNVDLQYTNITILYYHNTYFNNIMQTSRQKQRNRRHTGYKEAEQYRTLKNRTLNRINGDDDDDDQAYLACDVKWLHFRQRHRIIYRVTVTSFRLQYLTPLCWRCTTLQQWSVINDSMLAHCCVCKIHVTPVKYLVYE